MADPIRMLEDEHRVIEWVLGALETFAQNLRGDEQDRVTLRRFVEFFQDFLEKNHHGKEEQHLFARLEEHGFDRKSDEIALLLSGHAEGKDQLDALARVAAGKGEMTADEKDGIGPQVREFADRIRLHIEREDTVLFPRIARSLPAPALEALGRDFEEFVDKVLTRALLERLREKARSLAARHPPDPSKLQKPLPPRSGA